MEPSNFIYYVGPAIALVVLIGLYFFGVWSRSYIMPTTDGLPIKRQLVAAIPAGLLTMGLYAKSAFAALDDTPSGLVFDVAVMAAYAIIFGMLSRETLEHILRQAAPPGAQTGTPPAAE